MCARTKTKCIYYATYANGIDSVIPLPQLLADAGIVRQKGAWWYYEDQNGNPLTVNGTVCKFSSKNNFLDALRSNEVLYNELVQRLETGALVADLSESEIAEIEKENDEANQLMDAINRQEELDDINAVLKENP